ncbi:MAG: hypothetical protein JW974_01470 [Alphaproteobacteria bacterium]|nr:hypothetical protein [Alphaproteobacteria bacterium]MBN2675452.1 hypothetical protein [Alphaproteobacteria bacterium]
MKKSGISATLVTVVFAIPLVANGAYPAYPMYQTNGQVLQQGITYQQPTQQIVYQQQNPVVQANSVVASNPTRITGTLPRVGSNVTNAGRQYYQPADYDRLADSGLYIGLSLGYSASVSGAMNADYKNEQNAFFVPGAFKEATFDSETIMPLQFSVGAAINNDVRVDFSYTRYKGIEYPGSVMSSDGAGGFVKTQATGGAITSNATMLNLYYNVDSYTGYLAGGSMRPYIGAGVGISLNTIADYVILDNTFYSEKDPAEASAGELTGISDIYAYHNGGTSENLTYMLEGGVTTELEGGIKLDFFVRYSGLGNVRTSGSIVVSQTEWLGDGAGGEYEASYDSVFHYTNWYETGNLGTVDLGVRMRLQF